MKLLIGLLILVVAGCGGRAARNQAGDQGVLRASFIVCRCGPKSDCFGWDCIVLGCRSCSV